ncbi:AAA family ATPase [uncultured Clostridium sp.]|uniref:AAA family ATPase n=1 Tax=uncultured Clostridium sp. TaxID=59620 RepID=UPI0028E693E7|nr:AAA family ATPase [uncultured Clostridium sp.]
MKKPIPIGLGDFKKLITNELYYIDKTLFIKEFIESSENAILISRPRRFGKTLNLSMLKYFFDIRSKKDTKDLFRGLKIENERKIMELKGEYPVIFITFKNMRYFTYEDFIDGMRTLLSNLYKEHEYLLKSDKLSQIDKKDYIDIIARKSSTAAICNGISSLITYMNKHYGRKVMLFIDEYDVPLQESYIRGFYDNMIIIIRNLLISALTDNVYLEKAMITGILKIDNENIFSDLNNLYISTLLDSKFNDKFGFTELEIGEFLRYYNLSDKNEEIKTWYNGYNFGGQVIYNPWSVLNYIDNYEAGFMLYWINSSSNDLVNTLLLKGDNNLKIELQELMEGKSINKIIDDNIVMSEVEYSNENIWSFLTLSGYLKAVKTGVVRGRLHCNLKIPNKEVLIFYKSLIEKWFNKVMTNDCYKIMLETLTSGNITIFEGIFKEFVINNLSYFDVSGKEPERIYYAFVLGMFVSLSNEYEVKSNKESGYGIYDVMIIPKDISKIGIIIEFKKISYFLNSTIEEAAKTALKQIEEKKYEIELLQRGIKNIIKIAIVFKGNEIKIAQK